jgi:hypothetical protein
MYIYERRERESEKRWREGREGRVRERRREEWGGGR